MTLQLDIPEYERRLRQSTIRDRKHPIPALDNLTYWDGRRDSILIALGILKEMMDIDGWKRAHKAEDCCVVCGNHNDLRDDEDGDLICVNSEACIGRLKKITGVSHGNAT